MNSNHTLAQLIQKEIFQKYHLKLSTVSPYDWDYMKHFNPRETYGVLTSSRRAALVNVFFNILQEINPDIASLITKEDLFYLQIVALFQHSVWENNGAHDHIVDSKKNCHHFMEAINTPKSTILYFTQFLSNSNNQKLNTKEQWLLKILQSADKLTQIHRANNIFFVDALPLIEDFKRQNKADMLYHLAIEVLDLIIAQHDLPNDWCIQIKYNIDFHEKSATQFSARQRERYVQASNVYLKVVDDFKSLPLLAQYYQNDHLTSAQQYSFMEKKQREMIREKAARITIKSDFLIKSLRGNEDSFFLSFLDGVLPPHTHHPLRYANKKQYTVDGRGVHLRAEKQPTYPKEIKKEYSKKQSATYGTPDYHPIPFGFSREDLKMVGIIFFDVNKNALLSHYLSLYDVGSVARGNDFNRLSSAEHYFKQRTGIQLFSLNELNEFKRAIKKSTVLNELFAHLRFTPDEGCQLYINVDTLETRLLAQCYAKMIAHRVQAQQSLSNYYPTICYYMPGTPSLHLKQYTDDEQKMDLEEVAQIQQDETLVSTKIRSKNFEFLLHLSPEALRSCLKTVVDGHSLLIHLLKEGHFHFLSFFSELNVLSEHELQLMWREELAHLNEPELLMTILVNAIHKDQLALFQFALEVLSNLSGYETWLNAEITVTNGSGTILQHAILKSKYFEILRHHPGIDLKQSTKAGASFIHQAAISGVIELVQCAIDNGLDINQRVEENILSDFHPGFISHQVQYSPLHLAAIEGHADIVRLLLAQPTLVLKDTQQLLADVVSAHQVEILEILYADGRFDFRQKDRDSRSLMFTAEYDPTTMEFLLNLPEINILEKEPSRYGDGYSILHIATRQGYANVVALLLQKGMPVNDKSRHSDTALHSVIDCRAELSKPNKAERCSIIRMLLQAGIDKNALNSSNESALGLAVASKNTCFIEQLVNGGCNSSGVILPVLGATIDGTPRSVGALMYYSFLNRVNRVSSMWSPKPLEPEQPSNEADSSSSSLS